MRLQHTLSEKPSGFIMTALVVFLFILLLIVAFFVYRYFSTQQTHDVTKPQIIQIALQNALKEKGLTPGDPVFIRILKEEKYLELWMKPASAETYTLVKTYPVLAQSGTKGPKTKEGDKQAPEGFYRTFAHLLNPNSSYHLSFNVGYPNAYDLSLNRTGSFIMVHGGSTSIGCFAIGDEGIEEVYGIIEAYLKSPQGSQGVPIHIYPFLPTPDRLASEKAMEIPHYPFWEFLAKTWNHTEIQKSPPTIILYNNQLYIQEEHPHPIQGQKL